MRVQLFSFLLLVLGVSLVLSACQQDHVPAPESEAYRSVVSSFYTGVAAIQVGENFRAEGRLTEVTEQAPGEPAGWANRGVLALRQQNVEEAAGYLERARSLAPESGMMQYLSGVLERERGQLGPAVEYFRAAVEADSTHYRAQFALVQTLEQQGTDASNDEALRLMNRLRQQLPDNLVVSLERARLAAKQGRTALLQQTVDALASRSGPWPAGMQEQFQNVQEATAQSDLQGATTQIAFLTNELQRLPQYQLDRATVQPPVGQIGELVTRFLRMPTPRATPAPPDTALQFAADSLSIPDGSWDWVGDIVLSSDDPVDLIVANGTSAWIRTGFQRSETVPFPGGPTETPPTRHGLTALDYDYDFRMDVAMAGAGGVRLYRQTSQGTFEDETATAIPTAARNRPYEGVWTADLDMEGDLDLVLAPPTGAPVTLRNNGDGTFATTTLFPAVDQLRQFVWADIDGDGDPDVATINAEGRLQVFANQRQADPRFADQLLPDTLATAIAHGAGDVNSDGTLDLVILQADGDLHRLSATPNGTWEAAPLARWPDASSSATTESARLFVRDFDNNGALDVLASTPSAGQLWLSTANGTFQSSSTPINGHVFTPSDIRGEGRLDLLALDTGGTPRRLTNLGALGYQSKTIRPRAARVQGDRRINPYGLGGEIELRTGLLFQKQLIDGPTVLFGLGENKAADLARIIWPNGTVQAEFDLLSTQTALTRQRLKGSCPWVYTHNGEEFQFVTDFLWRTALGLRINAQGTAKVIHSEDRIKIDGDALAPQDGYYDIRITGELWETHFFDHVSLMAVDHPSDADIFVDERFTVPPSAPPIRTTSPLQPIDRALDHEGRDVTTVVRERDGDYLDTFDLGPFQGVAEEHFVEIDLGDDVPVDEPLWLVASGWVYPTDSSINLAIAQGDHPTPQSLQLEVPNGNGGWTVVREDLGFPAGKSKTMLINLSDVFGSDTPRRVRLRTTMEIYWDRLAWAAGRDDTTTEIHRLDAETADLRYRGFSAVRQESRRHPEIPIYDSLAATTPIWRDLVGYHTRFGDVRELTEQTDDRYVIMNAGDELHFRFPAPPPPPEGWTRSFVLVGDGWVKDGDYNTGYSTTVRPLPYHGQTDYDEPPGRLEDDPVYQRHTADWTTYHTRYVTPRSFQHALAPTNSQP
jgi:Tfp pilus assembly protein PilF